MERYVHKRTIHVVDDDEAIRGSALYMLRSFGFDVEAYESGAAFLGQVANAKPGCVLLDLRMPDMDGLEVQVELNARGVTMPVIVLTGHGDVAAAVAAMREGAHDFLEKPFEMSLLLTSVEGAFRKLALGADEAQDGQSARALIAALSPRERGVLLGLVMGKQHKVIAHDLSISPRTVEAYRAKLMGKLGVRNLSEALRLAFCAGLAGDRGAQPNQPSVK